MQLQKSGNMRVEYSNHLPRNFSGHTISPLPPPPRLSTPLHFQEEKSLRRRRRRRLWRQKKVVWRGAGCNTEKRGGRGKGRLWKWFIAGGEKGKRGDDLMSTFSVCGEKGGHFVSPIRCVQHIHESRYFLSNPLLKFSWPSLSAKEALCLRKQKKVGWGRGKYGKRRDGLVGCRDYWPI